MNKIICISCRKSIDEDSSFCKYCGAGVIIENAYRHEEKKLAGIFQNVYRTLQTCSDYSKEEFDEKFEPFKSYEYKILNNNDYYRLLVDIIFYSGFRASTVDKYLEKIHMHFPDYQVVSNYSLEELRESKMILT